MASAIRIESLDDSRVAEYRLMTDPAAMRRAGLFVAEGRFVVERLLESRRFRVRSILVTPAAFRQIGGPGWSGSAEVDRGWLEASPRTVYVADQRVLDGIVGFNIHRGCVALAERPEMMSMTDLPLAELDRALLLEGVGNPDNIGGIFRSAAAFGVGAVILGPGCGDPLYRKAIRTSMAATLQVPFADAGAWPEALQMVRQAGLTILALTPEAGALVLDDLPRDSRRLALLIGGEGRGLTGGALAAADRRVRIRTTAMVDSLNVTVAASIALHHFSAIGSTPSSASAAPRRLTPD